FRIEGQKTIVLELLQQLDWTAPDWIVLPAGNLGNTAAFGKALAEARDWGLVTDTPRLAAVQAAGAAPFAASFREGFARRPRAARAPALGPPAAPGQSARRDRPDAGRGRAGAPLARRTPSLTRVASSDVLYRRP